MATPSDVSDLPCQERRHLRVGRRAEGHPSHPQGFAHAPLPPKYTFTALSGPLMVANTFLSLCSLRREIPISSWVSSQTSKTNEFGVELQQGNVCFSLLAQWGRLREHSPRNFNVCKSFARQRAENITRGTRLVMLHKNVMENKIHCSEDRYCYSLSANCELLFS